MCVDAGESVQVRLAGGNRSGRVEIGFHGNWGTVCSRGWEKSDASVICRQLGYQQAFAALSRTTPGRGKIWTFDVGCHGSEDNILNCVTPNGWGNSGNCTHIEDAGVVCGGEFSAGVVCGGEFSAGVVCGGEFSAGVVCGGEFSAGVVCGDEFSAGVVCGVEFSAGVVCGGEFGAGVVCGVEFSAGVVCGGEFSAGVVCGDEFSAEVVCRGECSAGMAYKCIYCKHKFLVINLSQLFFCHFFQMTSLLLKSGSPVVMGPMEEWRWGLRGCGALSVTTAGMRMMPWLCVACWDTPRDWLPIFQHLGTGTVEFGSAMWTATGKRNR